MTNPRLNVGIASNDRRMFEIVLPNIGKIVCEASTKLDRPDRRPGGRAKAAGQAQLQAAQRGPDEGDRGLLKDDLAARMSPETPRDNPLGAG